MPIETWLTFVATVLLLMSTPGPSQLLMLSNSASNGLRRGLYTAAGDLTANFLQMLAAGLGVAALIAASATALGVIKWLGVAYLIYMGLAKIRSARAPQALETAPLASRRTLWLQGFITSAANPKAVVFFAALFPQFIDATLTFWPQFLILSATYLIIDGLFLTAYGGLAGWLAQRLQGAGRLWLDRTGGAFMILAGILLSFKSLKTA